MKPEWITTLVALHLDEEDDACARSETHDDLMLKVACGEISMRDAVVHLSDDEDAIRRVALFSPPSKEEQERERDMLLTEWFGPEDAKGPGRDESSAEAPAGPRVVPLESGTKEHTRHGSQWLWGGIVAAAAALLVWAVSSPTNQPEPTSVLSRYSPEWSGGYSGPIRSADGSDVANGCDQRLRATDPLTLRLRPPEGTADEVRLATLARQDDGEPQWLRLEWSLNDEGVISIEHEWTDLGLPAGRWTLTFFVVRADSMPSPAVLIDAGPGQHPGFTAVRSTVCVVAG